MRFNSVAAIGKFESVLINYFSDIHLEFGPLEIPENDSDIIIAAGDIGIYQQGLEWLASLSKPVIYIAGNHEFYDHEYHDTLDILRSAAANTNVHFLENDSVVIDGIRFLGCTFWTELGGEENDRIDDLLYTVNDFRKISYNNNLLEFEDYAELHRNSRQWLIEQLETPFSGETVVVTHHAPTHWSWDNSPSSLTRFAYCNDVRELIHQYEIQTWFHGHTHSVSDYKCAGARILCNPRGYVGRQKIRGFDPSKIVEI